MKSITMDIYDTNICCGCLSLGRRMLLIDDYWKKQCFSQIISEIPLSQPEEVDIWLCWECEAMLNKFIKFKQQVKNSCRMLHTYVNQNLNLSSLQQTSKLQTQKIINIAYGPNGTNVIQPQIEVIKVENNSDMEPKFSETKVNIMNESDNGTVYSDRNTDEDDKFLIEFRKKRRKQRKVLNGIVKKRKRKKKEDGGAEIYKVVGISETELQEERRQLAFKEEYMNAMFKCENCIVPFPNANDLKDHISMKHDMYASKYKCTVCQCSFGTKVSFNYHANKHKRRYDCTVCSSRFSTKRSFRSHYRMAHSHGTAMEYDIQINSHENSQNGGNHEPQENSVGQKQRTFPCELCEKTFRWKTSLRKHTETHKIETGQKRKPYCEPCRLSFTTTSNLQKHVTSSSKHQIQLKLRKLKESVLEDESTPEKQEARIEQIKSSVHSARKLFPCPQCDRRFQWRGNLLRHIHSHAAKAKGELVCKPCNRTFSSIATYQQHMKLSMKHVSEKDFKFMCSDCGKKFSNKAKLKDHIDWDHLKNYVNKCSICDKVFKSQTSLYLHKQMVHKKNGTEHLCDHCGKAFPSNAKLRTHITAIHTTESPYRCSSCSARFNWSSCLSRHVRLVHKNGAINRRKKCRDND